MSRMIGLGTLRQCVQWFMNDVANQQEPNSIYQNNGSCYYIYDKPDSTIERIVLTYKTYQEHYQGLGTDEIVRILEQKGD